MLHSAVSVQAIPLDARVSPAPAEKLFRSDSESSFITFPDGCSKFSVLFNGFLKSFILKSPFIIDNAVTTSKLMIGLSFCFLFLCYEAIIEYKC